MTFTFREFVKRNPLSITLREAEAAPSGGVPEAPPDPQKTTNKYHFDSLQRGLGIGDDDLVSALEGDALTVWSVPDYSQKWGFNVSGPVQANVKKRGDGRFDVTFLLKEKQQMEPKSFTRPYKKGERPLYFNGPIEDKTERISEEDLQDIMSKPMASMGGGGMPPMGGAPPMGGPGGPPMGGMSPMGGAPGAPPMGGM